jgi:hypothetical protein
MQTLQMAIEKMMGKENSYDLLSWAGIISQCNED